MPLQKIRVVVADDEALAREGIRELLRPLADIEIVAESPDGIRAVEDIASLHPDIVFLDIQMPGLDGFGVVSEIGAERMPVVIFVTAYDEFAVRAFDVHALDYLLKPIDPVRFMDALARARAQLQALTVPAFQQRLVELLKNTATGRPHREFVALKTGGKITLVRTTEIDWIDAEGDYVCVHTHGKKHLVRGRISEMETSLDPGRFARIHRSAIVNLEQIRELEPMFNGEYSLSLRDGTKLTVSRSYREKLFSRFHKPS